jgi:phosphate transport system permease protein
MSSPAQIISDPFEGVDLPKLEKSLQSPRALFSALMSLFTGGLTLLAALPLFSVLGLLLWRGGERLSLELFTETPPAAFAVGGGFGNAILGTLVMVGLAALIAIPFGVLAAVFLAEFGPESKTASAVRFCAKLLTGLPSILAGVFAYAAIVLTTGGFSAPAGGVALAMLMLPTVMLTAEEAIRMVPQRMKEAAIGMGCTPSQVVWRVMLPTAVPGILTGVMLAVARAAGETAPLIFTAQFSNNWIMSQRQVGMLFSRPASSLSRVGDALMEPTASLAVLIYNFAGMPSENQIELAWAASLVLVLLVLMLNILGQTISSRSNKR